MASNYNMLTRPPVVFVADGSARQVVRREIYGRPGAMRSRLIDNIVGLVRKVGAGATRSPSGRGAGNVTHTGRRAPHESPAGTPPSADTSVRAVQIEYSPCLDGDPDPGEVVWTWVPYEEDPSAGQGSPGGDHRPAWRPLGGGAVDVEGSRQRAAGCRRSRAVGPRGRVSYAKVERLLDVVPEQVRREGAVLERRHFDDVVAGVRRANRGQ